MSVSSNKYNFNPIVQEITKLNLRPERFYVGIPCTWLRKIILSNGKEADFISCAVLSYLCFRYNGFPVKDEETGEFIGYSAYWQGNMLQISRKEIGDFLNISLRQVDRALARLETDRLIYKETKPVYHATGVLLPNQLFIAPVPAHIEQLTHGGKDVRLVALKAGKTQKQEEIIPENNAALDHITLERNMMLHSNVTRDLDPEISRPCYVREEQGITLERNKVLRSNVTLLNNLSTAKVLSTGINTLSSTLKYKSSTRNQSSSINTKKPASSRKPAAKAARVLSPEHSEQVATNPEVSANYLSPLDSRSEQGSGQVVEASYTELPNPLTPPSPLAELDADTDPATFRVYRERSKTYARNLWYPALLSRTEKDFDAAPPPVHSTTGKTLTSQQLVADFIADLYGCDRPDYTQIIALSKSLGAALHGTSLDASGKSKAHKAATGREMYEFCLAQSHKQGTIRTTPIQFLISAAAHAKPQSGRTGGAFASARANTNSGSAKKQPQTQVAPQFHAESEAMKYLKGRVVSGNVPRPVLELAFDIPDEEFGKDRIGFAGHCLPDGTQLSIPNTIVELVFSSARLSPEYWQEQLDKSQRRLESTGHAMGIVEIETVKITFFKLMKKIWEENAK